MDDGMLIDEAMLSRAELEVLTAKANSILLQRSSTITKLGVFSKNLKVLLTNPELDEEQTSDLKAQQSEALSILKTLIDPNSPEGYGFAKATVFTVEGLCPPSSPSASSSAPTHSQQRQGSGQSPLKSNRLQIPRPPLDPKSSDPKSSDSDSSPSGSSPSDSEPASSDPASLAHSAYAAMWASRENRPIQEQFGGPGFAADDGAAGGLRAGLLYQNQIIIDEWACDEEAVNPWAPVPAKNPLDEWE